MEVLITSDQEKLPPEVRALLDETQPLAPGVAFFEQRFSADWLIKNALIGFGLLGFGTLLVLVGGVMFVDYFRRPQTVYSNNNIEMWLIIAGLVVMFAGWLHVASFPGGWALGRRQQAGVRTRYGIFLLPGMLVSRSWSDITVIPREQFRGLVTDALKYELKGQTKSYTLPPQWIGVSLAQLTAAINGWSQTQTGAPFSSSVAPPPLPVTPQR